LIGVHHHPDNRTDDSTYRLLQERIAFMGNPMQKWLSHVYLVIPESIGIHMMAHHMGDAPVPRGQCTEIEVIHTEIVFHVEKIMRRDCRPCEKNTWNCN